MGPDLEVLPVDPDLASETSMVSPKRSQHRLVVALALLLAVASVLAAGGAIQLRSVRAELADARTAAAEAERQNEASTAQLRSAEALANALRGALTTTTTAPATITKSVIPLKVEGEAVRGSPVSVSAAGVPPQTELDLLLSPIDGYGTVQIGTATSNDEGKAVFEAIVPQYFSHEGPCRTDLACDYVPVELGSQVLTVSPRNSKSIVAQGELKIIRARIGVAYTVHSTGECGPQRVDLDGTTWIAEEPADFVPGDGSTLVRGTLTLTSSRSARFTSEAGRQGTLRASTSGFFC